MAKKHEIKEVNEIVEPVVELETADLGGGLKVSVRDILKRKDEARAKREAEQAARKASPTGSRITRQKIMADIVYALKFLHDYEHGVELYVHMWEGEKPCHRICEVHYGRDCRFCKMSHPLYGECYALPVRCFLTWVYNNVGQTFTKRNERTGETNTYNLNPIKLAEIPLGKEDANVTVMQEAARRQYFMTDIWKIERKKGKGFLQPKTFADEKEFHSLVGKDVPIEISDKAKELARLSKKEIFKLILSAFEDVDWEALEIEPPTAIVEETAKPVSVVEDLLS